MSDLSVFPLLMVPVVQLVNDQNADIIAMQMEMKRHDGKAKRGTMFNSCSEGLAFQ